VSEEEVNKQLESSQNVVFATAPGISHPRTYCRSPPLPGSGAIWIPIFAGSSPCISWLSMGLRGPLHRRVSW